MLYKCLFIERLEIRGAAKALKLNSEYSVTLKPWEKKIILSLDFIASLSVRCVRVGITIKCKLLMDMGSAAVCGNYCMSVCMDTNKLLLACSPHLAVHSRRICLGCFLPCVFWWWGEEFFFGKVRKKAGMSFGDQMHSGDRSCCLIRGF